MFVEGCKLSDQKGSETESAQNTKTGDVLLYAYRALDDGALQSAVNSTMIDSVVAVIAMCGNKASAETFFDGYQTQPSLAAAQTFAKGVGCSIITKREFPLREFKAKLVLTRDQAQKDLIAAQKDSAGMKAAKGAAGILEWTGIIMPLYAWVPAIAAASSHLGEFIATSNPATMLVPAVVAGFGTIAAALGMSKSGASLRSWLIKKGEERCDSIRKASDKMQDVADPTVMIALDDTVFQQTLSYFRPGNIWE